MLRSLLRLPPAISLLPPAIRSAPAFFHPPANVFPFFLQLHCFATAGQFLVTVFHLLPQPLRIALRRRLRLPRRLVHLYGAINFLFQRLKIVCRNL